MSDAAAPTAPAPASDPAPAGSAPRRRRGRRVTRTADDLRSVVLACRVDPDMADRFTAQAQQADTDRAGLLVSLVAAAVARPTPTRHDRPAVRPAHRELSPLLRDLGELRGELREGHGALVRLAGIARAADDEATLRHANWTLGAQNRMVERVEAAVARIVEAIESAEGGHDGPVRRDP